MKGKTPTAIDLGCGAVSPPLLVEGADVRFTCSKQTAHGGPHTVTLVWDGESTLLDAPPWRGLESEVDE